MALVQALRLLPRRPAVRVAAAAVAAAAAAAVGGPRPAVRRAYATPPPPSGPATPEDLRGGASQSDAVPSPKDILQHFDLFGNQALGTDTRVDAYGSSWIVANNVRIDGPVVLSNRFLLRWNVDAPDRLTPDAFAILRVLRPLPELLLIGTGRRLLQLDPKLRASIRAMGVTVDVMTTPQASTTFNVLVQEGRLVVAALFPLDAVAPPAAGASSGPAATP